MRPNHRVKTTEQWNLISVVLITLHEVVLTLLKVRGTDYGKDFRTAPYINYTCTTLTLTLFQRQRA